MAWPGLGQVCSPVSGGQCDLAGQAGHASHDDQEGWPQKVEGGMGCVPWAVPRSSCGMTAMWGVDVTCIFCSCAVACLVLRELLLKVCYVE